MFFHFQLSPIAEIGPWGKKDKPELHWFGLSDGHYWIQIGKTELFRYSDALLAANPPQDPVLATHPLWPYVDYYVVRLWEDILEIMPSILDPLPAALVQRMEATDKWFQWCEKVSRWSYDEQDLCSDEVLDARNTMHIEALSWWWERHLYTGPLPDPSIYFWSDGQFVHCQWDSRDRLSEDGIPIWEAVPGTALIPIATFVDAVTSFNLKRRNVEKRPMFPQRSKREPT